MKGLAACLEGFYWQYLSTPEDRQRTYGVLLCGILTAALIIASGLALLLW